MNFLERIFATLQERPQRVVLQEARSDALVRATAADLLQLVGTARAFLRAQGLRPGDVCALLASNSIRWAAFDLAMMAEGVVKVPLYTRQPAQELADLLQDCGATLVVCGDGGLLDALRNAAPAAARLVLIEDALAAAGMAAVHEPPLARAADSVVSILYTSGTSGVAKGVVLTLGNIDHMLPCTMGRLDDLMRLHPGQERVFHYLPFCFAGSWILLLTSLTRGSLLTLATDLERLSDQMQTAAPHYFLNVPILLERVRSGVDDKLRQKGGLALGVYKRAQRAWERRQSGTATRLDALALWLGRALVFGKIKAKLSPNLVALICGSAALAKETQLYFEMLGVPVLQVYGLTETTAICTMDRPRGVRTAGRVGFAIDGVEMKLGEGDEILVRGPNLFPGYWKRPDESAACLRDGWFHTGDQGEVDASGNWRIIGRVKNVIVLSSGHNVAPDPIEEQLRAELPAAQQVLVVGHERKHLAAIVTGNVMPVQVDAALARVNRSLPHYRQVHTFLVRRNPFSLENGLLTANGKLKRQQILSELRHEIDAMYDGRDTRSR